MLAAHPAFLEEIQSVLELCFPLFTATAIEHSLRRCALNLAPCEDDGMDRRGDSWTAYWLWCLAGAGLSLGVLSILVGIFCLRHIFETIAVLTGSLQRAPSIDAFEARRKVSRPWLPTAGRDVT